MADSEGGTPELRRPCAVELSRTEAEALCYALDDADRLFMHHRADELLTLWDRLHRAMCYIDGEQGFHGTEEERSLHLTMRDALNLRLVVDAAWLKELPPRVRDHVRAIVERCQPAEVCNG